MATRSSSSSWAATAATVLVALLAGPLADASSSPAATTGGGVSFPSAGSGDGFLAVPVGTVARPARTAAGAKGKRAGRAVEAHLDNMAFFYATEVQIGTPAQRVTVLVDTGSSELWVNPDCSTAPSEAQSRQCAGFGQYEPERSRTPPEGPFGHETINYGDPSDQTTQTSVSIRYYRDTIAFGGGGAARVVNQTFGVVARSRGQSQGILGLAPTLRGGAHGRAPYSLVLNSMAAQGVIASRVFSLDLRRSDADKGAVIYGGVDRGRFAGRLERRPIVRGVQGEHRLAVELTTVGVSLPGQRPQNFAVAGDDANVMLDSGTTVSRIHPAVALPILEALEARDDGEGYYRVPCAAARAAAGTVDFGFGPKTIRVPFRDFILDMAGDASVCYVGMVLTTDQQILGDSVLRAGYFVFDWDNGAVHIAQAASCGPSDIVAVGSGPDAVPSVAGHCGADAGPADATVTGKVY
ncbi:hypothetical protein CDD83_9834 [Cordyceps sp. RAO-2017]|nr:hypothetical protein CDD83_9834 [Cordyceps sp. RAO-2017]